MIVGFIGLGTMGGPMARNLVAKSHRVIVYDVQPAAVRALTDAGASTAATPKEVAAASEIVITMLPDAPDVERVALGRDGIVEGIRPGAVYIDMSTIDPGTTRKVGAAIAAKGAAMIDSPVGKTADHAVAGTLTLMVGGPAEVVARCREVLDCMGTDFFHCGELGAGQTMKLLNNLLAAAVGEASIEALVAGTKAGLTLDTMLSVLRDDDGVEQPARDRDAEAIAGRRLQARLHDEARAQGLPARVADGRRAWCRGAGRPRSPREPCGRHRPRASGQRRGCAAETARGAGGSAGPAAHPGVTMAAFGAAGGFDPIATRRIGRREPAVSLLGAGTAPFGSLAAGR